MNNKKLKRAIDRTARFYQNIGYRFSLCGGLLGDTFDLSLDSVYENHPGIYAAVFIQRIPEKSYKNILAYQTKKLKEISLWIFDESVKNDGGRCAVYRIEGKKIVEYPQNLPIENVVSSPSKHRASSSKG